QFNPAVEVNVMSDVADRVKKIVVEHLGVDEAKVTENASFIDDLGADSLDTVELVMAFEEEFGCEIPDDAAEKIVTVKAAISFIEATRLGCGRRGLGAARDVSELGPNRNETRRHYGNGYGHSAGLRSGRDVAPAAREPIRHRRHSGVRCFRYDRQDRGH